MPSFYDLDLPGKLEILDKLYCRARACGCAKTHVTLPDDFDYSKVDWHKTSQDDFIRGNVAYLPEPNTVNSVFHTESGDSKRVLTSNDLIGLRQNDILTRAEVRVALGYPAKSELASFSPKVLGIDLNEKYPAPVTRHEITEMLMRVIGDGGPLLSPMQASVFANELNERFLIVSSPVQQVSEVPAPQQTVTGVVHDPSTWVVNDSGSSVIPADKEPETVPYYENYADLSKRTGSVFPPTPITALEVANIINVALEITGYPYFKWALIADKLNERFGFSK